jgi:hypothetical protein
MIRVEMLAVVVVVVARSLAPPASCAQVVSIRGRVLFSDGSIPTLAHVTVGNRATAAKIVEPDTNGNYAITDLPAGTYDLAAFGVSLGDSNRQAGFHIQKNIEIAPNQTSPNVIDITLEQREPPNAAGAGERRGAPEPQR